MKNFKITGRAVPIFGDDIDTDRIFPARFMKEITFRNALKYAFFDERFDADGNTKRHPFNEAEFQDSSILLANANFGCGSSREHAPKSLACRGIQAIVAQSFGEIFANNCVMLGVAAVMASKEDINRLQQHALMHPDEQYSLNLAEMVIKTENLTIPVTMPDSHRKTLIDGTWDTTAMLLANSELVEKVARRLDKMYA